MKELTFNFFLNVYAYAFRQRGSMNYAWEEDGHCYLLYNRGKEYFFHEFPQETDYHTYNAVIGRLTSADKVRLKKYIPVSIRHCTIQLDSKYGKFMLNHFQEVSDVPVRGRNLKTVNLKAQNVLQFISYDLSGDVVTIDFLWKQDKYCFSASYRNAVWTYKRISEKEYRNWRNLLSQQNFEGWNSQSLSFYTLDCVNLDIDIKLFNC